MNTTDLASGAVVAGVTWMTMTLLFGTCMQSFMCMLSKCNICCTVKWFLSRGSTVCYVYLSQLDADLGRGGRGFRVSWIAHPFCLQLFNIERFFSVLCFAVTTWRRFREGVRGFQVSWIAYPFYLQLVLSGSRLSVCCVCKSVFVCACLGQWSSPTNSNTLISFTPWTWHLMIVP